jgi:hypothetical protein
MRSPFHAGPQTQPAIDRFDREHYRAEESPADCFGMAAGDLILKVAQHKEVFVEVLREIELRVNGSSRVE